VEKTNGQRIPPGLAGYILLVTKSPFTKACLLFHQIQSRIGGVVIKLVRESPSPKLKETIKCINKQFDLFVYQK